MVSTFPSLWVFNNFSLPFICSFFFYVDCLLLQQQQPNRNPIWAVRRTNIMTERRMEMAAINCARRDSAEIRSILSKLSIYFYFIFSLSLSLFLYFSLVHFNNVDFAQF